MEYCCFHYFSLIILTPPVLFIWLGDVESPFILCKMRVICIRHDMYGCCCLPEIQRCGVLHVSARWWRLCNRFGLPATSKLNSFIVHTLVVVPLICQSDDGNKHALVKASTKFQKRTILKYNYNNDKFI